MTERLECARVRPWLVDRAYAESTGPDGADCEAHVAACASCRELAARYATLARVGPAGRGAAAALLSTTARGRLEEVLEERRVRSMAGWFARWFLAGGLASVSCLALCSRPAVAGLSTPLALAHLLAWFGLYGTLLDRLSLDRDGPAAGIRSRAVVYGVLAAVSLFVVALGSFLAMGHRIWPCHLPGGLSHLVAVFASLALLVVGLIMGISMGRVSSVNMVAVLAVYATIMFPALSRGSPALLRSDDVVFGLLLVLLWGLGGAHIGAVLCGDDRRRTAT